MSDRDRRYSKRELLGDLHVDYGLSVTDLGLAARSNRWDVLRAFLRQNQSYRAMPDAVTGCRSLVVAATRLQGLRATATLVLR